MSIELFGPVHIRIDLRERHHARRTKRGYGLRSLQNRNRITERYSLFDRRIVFVDVDTHPPTRRVRGRRQRTRRISGPGLPISLGRPRCLQTQRVTPAMEAGIADHVWTVDEIVGLLQRYDYATCPVVGAGAPQIPWPYQQGTVLVCIDPNECYVVCGHAE